MLLTGAGRAFCSGADLRRHGPPTPDGHPDLQRALHERYHPVLIGMRELPKPVVTRRERPVRRRRNVARTVRRPRLARPSAYFLLAFVNIGLVPDGGSSAFVPARIGLARATEMAMLGERLPRRQAPNGA